jgi:protein arginine kinase
MINEEDHLRIQILTAGWSIRTASQTLDRVLQCLEPHLEFAASEEFGYLASSPLNAGGGRRLSAMFHLIGLANAKRLPKALQALADQGFAARGLFGESSRAIGAFVQVSMTSGDSTAFAGACEYLISEEREARRTVGLDQIQERAEKVKEFVLSSRTVTLADALRTLAWIRLAHRMGLPGMEFAPRALDAALTTLETHVGGDPERANERRADFLRTLLRL